ncbi:MAG: tetratricopeptide repeat protein [Terriglobia bacterium]
MAKANGLRFERAAMALLIWGMAAPLMAQGGGAVTGLAIDQQGKPLAGYTVAIEDLNTHYVYRTKTNGKGAYTLVDLPLHVYKLTLEDQSGKELRSIGGQSLTNGGLTTINFDLKDNPTQAGGGGQVPRLNSVSVEGPVMTSSKDRSSKRYPKKIAGLVDRGQHEASAGQLAQAAADFQQAIQLAPTDANLENELGIVYTGLNNVEGAVQAFQKAADLDPQHAGQFYFNLGGVYWNHGQVDAAAQAFKKCLQADPDNAEAYYWEGQALLAKAQTLPGGKTVAPPGTVEAYETYLKLSPNGPHADMARQILQTIAPGTDGQH